MSRTIDSTLEAAIFELVTAADAKEILNGLERDEEGDVESEDDAVEAFSECAQIKFDTAQNVGELTEPFAHIVQVALEVVDWTEHPHFIL